MEKETKSIFCGYNITGVSCLGQVTLWDLPLEALVAYATALEAKSVRLITAVVCGTGFLGTISPSSDEGFGIH
jgi:hypothetical protein